MSYSFKGDLCQMFEQRDLLTRYGCKIIMSNVYPTVETEDEYKRALSLIWTMKCEGWWHYKEQYAKYGICTNTEFNLRLFNGKLRLKTVLDDNKLLPNEWDTWWKLIGTEKIKINDIPVVGIKEEIDYCGQKTTRTQLYVGDLKADDNNVEVKIGDKISIEDKEFIVQ